MRATSLENIIFTKQTEVPEVMNDMAGTGSLSGGRRGEYQNTMDYLEERAPSLTLGDGADADGGAARHRGPHYVHLTAA